MIEPIALADWVDFDERHPAPTFFARPAWASALAYAYPHLRPYPVTVECGGKKLLIPLMQTSGGRSGLKGLVGTPLGCYTCAMHEDGSLATALEFERALAELSRISNALTIVPWPLAPLPAMSNWRRSPRETAVIDVSQGAEHALKGLAGVSRRMAGQAARRGVACAPLDSALAVTTYYGMLREAAENWSSAGPPYPKELLEGLVAYGGKDVEIWFARCDSHAIAGGIVVYGSQELYFWSAAMRRAYAQLRPSNALNVALIEAAARRKVNWYNLGESEGLPGVERFKRGLGARSIVYDELRHEDILINAYRRLRSSLGRVPWRSAAGRVGR